MVSVAVIIPCYKVKAHILQVLERIGSEVHRIYVVDDCCPERSGDFVEAHCTDHRVRVIRHQVNRGVGGAVMTGYQAALDDGMEIMVKIDGDGQMDPGLVPDFIAPILAGEADYTKGNRFFDLEQIQQMPTVRLVGNAMLSFLNKISSGYWNLFDPTNGYTAIHRDVADSLPFRRISERYFFESDMLFRLNTLRAVVVDIPMDAFYGDEVSNLRVSKVVSEFFFKHLRNTAKRIFYNYYLRDLSLASVQLPLGIGLIAFGSIFGIYKWHEAASIGVTATAGAVMMSALPVLVGIELLLAFLGQDIQSVPQRPFLRTSRTLERFRESAAHYKQVAAPEEQPPHLPTWRPRNASRVDSSSVQARRVISHNPVSSASKEHPLC
ncbi:MAG: glycosyltransferase family 2 protein [Lautropia sp.]|nr:glycosyltransferase family 2 protein [Lautropia sp.]